MVCLNYRIVGVNWGLGMKMDAKQEKRDDEKSREMWMHVVAIDECSSRRSDRSAVEDIWTLAKCRLFCHFFVFLRIYQQAFVTISVFQILLTSGIPSHGFLRSLLGAFAIQSLWSLCLAIADVVYWLSLKSGFIALILWIGDSIISFVTLCFANSFIHKMSDLEKVLQHA
nr:CASP-like protein 5A2 [Ipomoea trifida]